MTEVLAGLADEIYFPEGTPIEEIQSEQNLIRRLASVVLSGCGNVIMMSRDDTERIYQMLNDQCYRLITADERVDEIERDFGVINKVVQDYIKKIYATIPEEIDFTIPEKYQDDTLNEMSGILVFVEKLLELYEEKSEEVAALAKENNDLRSVASVINPVYDEIKKAEMGEVVEL
jgi:uncharacterized protein with von Willebrand factor type A (vWA) domain